MGKTLDQEFEEFARRVYDGQLQRGSEQWNQLRDAFWGGCLVAYSSRRDFTKELRARGLELKQHDAIPFEGIVN